MIDAQWYVAALEVACAAYIGNALGLALRDYDDRRRTARRCARGEHRETVRSTPIAGGYLALCCLDCPHVTPLYAGLVFTPQRRQKHGRAA